MDNEVMKKIVGKLEDNDGDVRISAINALKELSGMIDSEVVEKIVALKNIAACIVLKGLHQNGKLEFLG